MIMCLLISSVWVYVLIVLFSVQDYVFIYFLCLGVCVDCFFSVQDYVFIDFLSLGVCVDCTFFCSGLCVYLFPLFWCMC